MTAAPAVSAAVTMSAAMTVSAAVPGFTMSAMTMPAAVSVVFIAAMAMSAAAFSGFLPAVRSLAARDLPAGELSHLDDAVFRDRRDTGDHRPRPPVHRHVNGTFFTPSASPAGRGNPDLLLPQHIQQPPSDRDGDHLFLILITDRNNRHNSFFSKSVVILSQYWDNKQS